MNNFRSLITVFAMSISALAPQIASANLTKSQKAIVSETMKCTRTMIENPDHGEKGVQFAGAILDKLSLSIRSNNVTSNLVNECEGLKSQAEMHSNNGLKFDRNAQWRAIRASQNSVSDASYRQMVRFFYPTVTCTGLDISSDIGVGLALGLKVGLVSYCSATNGRHWVQSSVDFKAGYGLGIFGGLAGFERFHFSGIFRQGAFASTPTKSMKAGFFLGYIEEARGERYQHKTKGFYFTIPTKGFDKLFEEPLYIPMGFIKNWGRELHLKYAPLGTRDGRLMNAFIEESQ